MEAEPRNFGPITLRPASNADGVPLFHAAWLFALGIVVAEFIELRPTYLLIALFPVAILCGIAALRAQRIAWLPLAALWCLLGAWCAEMQPQPAPAPALAALSDGLVRNVEGTIIDAGAVRGELEQNVDEAQSTAPTQRLDVRIASVEVVTNDEDAQEAMPGGVRLTVRWPEGQHDIAGFHCGQRIRADARLMQPEVYRDPGAWSRRDYLLDQGITSTATVNVDRVGVLGAAHERSWACRISAWQRAASLRILALPAAMQKMRAPLRLSEDDSIMVAAMVTGDRTYLTHSLRVGFERTGSFHMLVVSGLHLAIVAALIVWITRRLRMPQPPATLVTIVASLAYALFTGFATPVQRSLWMVTLYLVGRRQHDFGKRTDPRARTASRAGNHQQRRFRQRLRPNSRYHRMTSLRSGQLPFGSVRIHCTPALLPKRSQEASFPRREIRHWKDRFFLAVNSPAIVRSQEETGR